MGFFDTPEGVEQYVKMAAGYDGRDLIAVLKKHLSAGSSILELGMGPGVDLDMLAADYTVTGSDMSQAFLDRYRKMHPDADLLLLDAVHPDTDCTFDALYSNKVLHHLPPDDLATSFNAQLGLLNPGGLVLHSFWYGDKTEEMEGLLFVYYTEETLREKIGSGFEMIASERYTEMEAVDSFYVLLRKK